MGIGRLGPAWATCSPASQRGRSLASSRPHQSVPGVAQEWHGLPVAPVPAWKLPAPVTEPRPSRTVPSTGHGCPFCPEAWRQGPSWGRGALGVCVDRDSDGQLIPVTALSSEFFADNLGDFLIFLRRFADDILETSADSLEHVLHFVTVFTGSIERCGAGSRALALISPAGHLEDFSAGKRTRLARRALPSEVVLTSVGPLASRGAARNPTPQKRNKPRVLPTGNLN